MMLSFKDRFVDAIQNGTKIHTIREDTNNRWKPGVKIHFATGLRTPNYNCFREGVCTGVQDIIIARYRIVIDILEIELKKWDELAKNDGFDNADAMIDWFRFHYDLPFFGRLIHWTDYKYIYQETDNNNDME